MYHLRHAVAVMMSHGGGRGIGLCDVANGSVAADAKDWGYADMFEA